MTNPWDIHSQVWPLKVSAWQHVPLTMGPNSILPTMGCSACGGGCGGSMNADTMGASRARAHDSREATRRNAAIRAFGRDPRSPRVTAWVNVIGDGADVWTVAEAAKSGGDRVLGQVSVSYPSGSMRGMDADMNMAMAGIRARRRKRRAAKRQAGRASSAAAAALDVATSIADRVGGFFGGGGGGGDAQAYDASYAEPAASGTDTSTMLMYGVAAAAGAFALYKLSTRK